MSDFVRKITVGICVLVALVLAATGIGWWLAGQLWSLLGLMVIITIPTILVIKLIRKIGKSA